jgi:hypothetical protein
MIKRIPIGTIGINYKQHEVHVAGSCPLLLRDHREVEEAPGAVTIENGVVTRANVADVTFPNAELKEGISITDPLHVVCHLTEDRENIQFLEPAAPGAENAKAPRLVILHVSAGADRVSLPSKADERAVWLSMASRTAYAKVDVWLKQFLNLSFEDAEKIAKSPERAVLDPKIQQKYAQLLDITHPGDPAAPLAFHLLCEAWKIKNIDLKDDCEGIPITAPSNLTVWLAPFSPEGNDDPARIASVVSKMGDTDTKDKAKMVLEAANGAPKTHVLAFLGIEGQAPDQAEGGPQ